MINSDSIQYLPVLEENNEGDILTYSKISINDENNNDSINAYYPKYVLERNNSSLLLNGNFQFKNLLPIFSPVRETYINKDIYNISQYSNDENDVTYLNQNDSLKMSQGLKRYHSYENLFNINSNKNIFTTEENDEISLTNSKPAEVNINSDTRLDVKVHKKKSSLIPHPIFSGKKINNYEVIANNNYDQIFINQNISNNIPNYSQSALNESFNSLVNNYLNNSNNYSVESDNYNQIFVEEEPEMEFKISEFTILNRIGSGSEGSTFIVNWQKNNKNYALKKCEYMYEETGKRKKKEFLYLKEFIETNNCDDGIIKTYGNVCIPSDFGSYYYYELMELAERDWEQEIKNREQSQYYYQEYELMDIFRHLIKTFSALQTAHYTHRDIKPQNIILVNGKYKICDFGDGKVLKRDGNIVQRIRGSELYMSPIIFKGYRSGMPTIKHNTYKSDVFSLGMCFFYAANLGNSGLNRIRELYDMKIIKKVLNQCLARRYSENLISLLFTMLQVEEKKRPDFNELEILMN